MATASNMARNQDGRENGTNGRVDACLSLFGEIPRSTVKGIFSIHYKEHSRDLRLPRPPAGRLGAAPRPRPVSRMCVSPRVPRSV